MKKRVFSLALCALLCFTVCFTAFADGVTVSFQQIWSLTGTDTPPNEDLDLTVTSDAGNPDPQKMITLTKREDGTVVVNYPDTGFNSLGIYKYSITQVPGSAQGAVYDTGTIGIEVLFAYNENNETEVTQTVLSKVGDTKKDKFENTYSTGSLTVTHKVRGNTGDKNAEFPVSVTLHADKDVKTAIHYTVNGGDTLTLPVNWSGEKQLDFLLKDTGSVAFSDIPEGVSYLVSAETENNYEVTIDSESGTISNIAPSSVSIVHKSETNLNTGISFDIIPYVIALGVVVCGLFLLSLRRKHEKNED